jgi:hypothetical protein
MAIDEEEARKISKKQIQFLPNEDPLYGPLKDTTAGDPILVRNVFRQPTYWIVPLLKKTRIAGFVRVLLNGKVAHLGIFNTSGRSKNNNPVITGVELSEAYKLATEKIRKELGESASEPVFVHDGPIGKEAWLVEVSIDDKPNRWIFVTGELVYERRAGETRDSTLG